MAYINTILNKWMRIWMNTKKICVSYIRNIYMKVRKVFQDNLNEEIILKISHLIKV